MTPYALLLLLASTLAASGVVSPSSLPSDQQPKTPPLSDLVGDSVVASAVLQKKCIKAQAGGTLALPFEGVVEMLGETNLFSRAQTTYADMLPDGKRPTVQVTPLSDNRYRMVNKKGQGTDIAEIYRASSAPGTIDSVYHIKAKRFFGVFEAVIHVQGEKLSEEQSAYHVNVYAYPHNRLVRGITRQLHLVQRFFDKKTSHITNVLTTLGQELMNPTDLT